VPVAVLPRLEGDLAGGYYSRAGRCVIIINADDLPARMRFTLAHELAHHYFRHLERVPALRGAANIQDTRRDIAYAHDWWEVQANAFASELLIPEPAVACWDAQRTVTGIGLDAVADLACTFGTSLTMAAIRLGTAGLIADDAWVQRLKKEINAGHADAFVERYEPYEDGVSRARESAPRIPPALANTVFASHASGRRKVRDAAVRETMAELDLLGHE